MTSFFFAFSFAKYFLGKELFIFPVHTDLNTLNNFMTNGLMVEKFLCKIFCFYLFVHVHVYLGCISNISGKNFNFANFLRKKTFCRFGNHMHCWVVVENKLNVYKFSSRETLGRYIYSADARVSRKSNFSFIFHIKSKENCSKK